MKSGMTAGLGVWRTANPRGTFGELSVKLSQLKLC